MPVVHIDILKRPVAAKRKLVRAVTDALVSSLGVAPESVSIVLHEMAPENYAVAGALHGDKLAKKPRTKSSQK
ncbi:MAG: tautomerase family protein [Alphaproteobacteria bacterium]|nr:tautomerase family protein [Alphaproteobacteria bacterium]